MLCDMDHLEPKLLSSVKVVKFRLAIDVAELIVIRFTPDKSEIRCLPGCNSNCIRFARIVTFVDCGGRSSALDDKENQY